jgi:hypothetical protein
MFDGKVAQIPESTKQYRFRVRVSRTVGIVAYLCTFRWLCCNPRSHISSSFVDTSEVAWWVDGPSKRDLVHLFSCYIFMLGCRIFKNVFGFCFPDGYSYSHGDVVFS